MTLSNAQIETLKQFAIKNAYTHTYDSYSGFRFIRCNDCGQETYMGSGEKIKHVIGCIIGELEEGNDA